MILFEMNQIIEANLVKESLTNFFYLKINIILAKDKI